MSAKVVWFEVMGHDADKLRGFYADLFDWDFTPAPNIDYGMVDSHATGIGGGIGKAPQGPGWTTFYVDVDDLGATLARAGAAGAQVLMPPTQLPDKSMIAVFADPEGRPVGLIQQPAAA